MCQKQNLILINDPKFGCLTSSCHIYGSRQQSTEEAQSIGSAMKTSQHAFQYFLYPQPSLVGMGCYNTDAGANPGPNVRQMNNTRFG